MWSEGYHSESHFPCLKNQDGISFSYTHHPLKNKIKQKQEQQKQKQTSTYCSLFKIYLCNESSHLSLFWALNFKPPYLLNPHLFVLRFLDLMLDNAPLGFWGGLVKNYDLKFFHSTPFFKKNWNMIDMQYLISFRCII